MHEVGSNSWKKQYPLRTLSRTQKTCKFCSRELNLNLMDRANVIKSSKWHLVWNYPFWLMKTKMVRIVEVPLTKPSLHRLPASSRSRLMEKLCFWSTCFPGEPTTEMTDSGLSGSQLHFREPVNLQSQLRSDVSEFQVPRHAGTGHKWLFRFLNKKK